MNFEGFKQLVHRIGSEWYKAVKKDPSCDMEIINLYLNNDPFTAKQTPENEEAYEHLMDVRMKLYVSVI